MSSLPAGERQPMISKANRRVLKSRLRWAEDASEETRLPYEVFVPPPELEFQWRLVDSKSTPTSASRQLVWCHH